MIKTDELFAEAVSLPIEIRQQLVERLLQRLHPAQTEIDKLWADEDENRVKEIKSGEVKNRPFDITAKIEKAVKHRQ